MPGRCELHVLQARTVVKRGGDERGTHRMRRVSPTESNVPRILAEEPVDDIRMQVPTCFKAFAIVAHGPEE